MKICEKFSIFIFLVSITSLCIFFGCVFVGGFDIPERSIEYHVGFVVEVDYIPETFWGVDRTVITFSDGNVLILSGIHGIPQNQVINISYYKEDWNGKPYYPFISVEVV